MPSLGSLFSGIGGIDLAAEVAGFQTAFQVEIDPACQTVLRRHWPDVPKYGDITSVKGSDLGYCDVLAGGFPCQDLSVAGKRAGLGGSRSGLFFEFARLIRECRPRFAVIENVPGLLSSNKGWDFAVLLDTLGECGATDIGWRVLDAQFTGVPQRRRRVVVVADFGTQRCGEVLSLAEGVRGNPAPRRSARQDVAGTLGGGAGSRGWAIDVLNGQLSDVVPTITAPEPLHRLENGKRQDGGRSDRKPQALVLYPIGVWSDPETARCLSSRNERIDAETETTNVSVSASSVAYALTERSRDGGMTPEWSENLAYALTNPGNGGRTDRRMIVHATPIANTIPASAGHHGHSSPRGDGNDNQVVVAAQSDALRGRKGGATAELGGEIATALRASQGGGDKPYVLVVTDDGREWLVGVRRLTPRECERLQGFPDDFTDGQADAHRYRQLGNAVAVPVFEQVFARLAAVLADEKELVA